MNARHFLLFAMLAVAAVAPARAPAQEIVSEAGAKVRVIDGDTLEVAHHVVQLYGIDAPELGQVCMENDAPWQCGLQAALALRKIIAVEHAVVRCRQWGPPRDVFTAVCEAGHVDLGQHLISAGHAVALADAFPEYLDYQRSAKEAGVGLWRGSFVPPADWRRGTRLPGEDALRGDIAACPVKAKSDGRGGKVFYVPTDPKYGSIRVRPERGDRCFQSDEAARAKGW